MLQAYLIYQSNQSKTNATTKLDNVSMSEKRKPWFKTLTFHFSIVTSSVLMDILEEIEAKKLDNRNIMKIHSF